MPSVEAVISDAPADAVSKEERFALARRLETKLGDLDFYNCVFDPYDMQDTAPVVVGSLSDDLSDIYWDVKDGLTACASGPPPDDVIWEWRVGFEEHWGIHASAALYAIHWITRNPGARWIPDDPD